MNLDRFLGLAGSEARADTVALKQISDLIGQQGCTGAGRRFNLWHLQLTVLKLQSDWNGQIPFPGPRIVT